MTYPFFIKQEVRILLEQKEYFEQRINYVRSLNCNKKAKEAILRNLINDLEGVKGKIAGYID